MQIGDDMVIFGGPSSLPAPVDFLFGLIQRNKIKRACSYQSNDILRGYWDELISDASGCSPI